MRRTSPVIAALALLLAPSAAFAFEPFAYLVPCRATATNDVGTSRPCITCHNNPNGGGGCDAPPCFNPFGAAFDGNGRTWNETLAALDSDGDGYTNGEELGDPAGTWRPEQGLRDCHCASRPGFTSCAASGADSLCTPGEVDADEDGYCCVGQNTDGAPGCTGAGEHDGSFDCDEMNMSVHSGATELCTDTLDNDCDGLPTLLDPECASVVDRDHDGFCAMGRDLSSPPDHDCIDAGEVTGDVDCDDEEITVFPTARENCVDGLDNDCNGAIDTEDPMCTSDVDADADGYCPIGRDIDGSGDCNGAGELDGSIDCDDMNAAVSSGQLESAALGVCGDGLDNDCDGVADRLEPECASVFDLDGDGYCPSGAGSCADASAMPGDCDDGDPAISPGRMELCENGPIDDDCDGDASLADADCAGYLDADGDRYCFVGFDMDGDGACLGDEVTGQSDCDDGDPTLSPATMEVCTDALDNDCDGVTDAQDGGQCSAYEDHDEDGYCLVGADVNGDGDCDDAGEQSGETEQAGDASSPLGTDLDPTVYPGAPENCLDRVDNDLDGMVDEAAACTGDADADGDGYCPIGQDVNGDGDCLDDGENRAVSDCDDGDATFHPGAVEMCRATVDLDCDGDWMLADDDCAHLVDRDRDGVCAMGVDDNGDQDCADEGEDRFGEDCDDFDPAVSPRATEVCDDDIDNNCDGATDYADLQCTCQAAADCDDGDPCTVDSCGGGRCAWAPSSACGDGGLAADAGPVGAPGGGCGCRAASGEGRAAIWGWMVLGLVLSIRRMRRARRMEKRC